MFEIFDIIGIIMCIICGLSFFVLTHITSRKVNNDLRKLESEREFLTLEYKYQLEKLIEELERLIEAKKHE